MTTPKRKGKKATKQVGWIPQGRHDSAGAANSWKLSTFPAQYPGRGAVCHQPIKVGDNVQMARSGKGRIHPHCVSGRPNPPKEESRGRVVSSRVEPKRRSTFTKPIRSTSAAQGGVERREDSMDQTRVERINLPAEPGLIIGNTSCPTCKCPTGTPCTNAGTSWIHQARLDQFKP